MHTRAGSATRTPPALLAERLRDATRPAHERAEAAVDLPARLRSVADYADLLVRLEAFHRVTEGRVAHAVHAAGVPAPLRRDWTRAHLLRADLAALGVPAPPSSSGQGTGPDLPTAGHRRGAWYVLEGSRLGAGVISREVRRRLPDAVPATGAMTAGPDLGARWRTFRTWLDAAPATEHEAAVEGAVRTFDALHVGLAA